MVLLNMVAGPQDVDEALGPETKEHCDRYGAVDQVGPQPPSGPGGGWAVGARRRLSDVRGAGMEISPRCGPPNVSVCVCARACFFLAKCYHFRKRLFTLEVVWHVCCVIGVGWR